MGGGQRFHIYYIIDYVVVLIGCDGMNSLCCYCPCCDLLHSDRPRGGGGGI